MRFSCDTKALASAIALVGRVINPRVMIPILRDVKIIAQGDRLALTGTSMDATIESMVPAEIAAEGAICVPFETLQKFVRSSKAAAVTMEIDGPSAVVRSGRGRIALATLPPEDFPNALPVEGDPGKVEADAFARALRFCVAAVEDSEVAYHIAGVRLDAGPLDTIAWGTNGKTCHRALIPAGLAGGGGTVPMPAVATILALLDGATSAEALVSDRGWHIVTPSARAWGKVVDGAYPDMNRVTGQFGSWADVAEIARDDLAEGLAIATCGADTDSQKFRNVVIRASAGRSIVLRGLKAIGDVIHAGRAELAAESGADWVGVVNSRFLAAAIAGDGPFALRAADNGRAINVTADDGTEAIIMTYGATEAEMADV